MTDNRNLSIQCECGGSYTYVFTSNPRSAYKCKSCRHRIFIINIDYKEGKSFDSHMGYKG